jgi:hypothetical protein
MGTVATEAGTSAILAIVLRETKFFPSRTKLSTQPWGHEQILVQPVQKTFLLLLAQRTEFEQQRYNLDFVRPFHFLVLISLREPRDRTQQRVKAYPCEK